ncbi:MAG: hypothetical protein WCK95_15360 [Alphaproteobacteria bacterium]|jgi:Arc/MetJ-type ribon-helix-helix transcriptional regulator
MTITLAREQQEWLESQVKAGVYSSVDEAVADIVSQRMRFEQLVQAEQPFDKLERLG